MKTPAPAIGKLLARAAAAQQRTRREGFWPRVIVLVLTFATGLVTGAAVALLEYVGTP